MIIKIILSNNWNSFPKQGYEVPFVSLLVIILPVLELRSIQSGLRFVCH